MPLHLSIAFFGIQVAAWVGLGIYLYATRQRRSEAKFSQMLTDATSNPDGLAQA
ncbi:hypothetical protein [Terrihabitans sp. B22-R8]|uniref:hypothetical protein n=1 Tax=Terrihabitans sp. B22-R8 TaxID=3425128 RepID=UPI00403D2727